MHENIISILINLFCKGLLSILTNVHRQVKSYYTFCLSLTTQWIQKRANIGQTEVKRKIAKNIQSKNNKGSYLTKGGKTKLKLSTRQNKMLNLIRHKIIFQELSYLDSGLIMIFIGFSNTQTSINYIFMKFFCSPVFLLYCISVHLVKKSTSYSIFF